MDSHRQELVRLLRTALDRPRWQTAAAFAVSAWTLLWIGGQFTGHAPTALGVLDWLAALLGLDGSAWTGRLGTVWAQAGSWLAMVGGLLWAATSERGQATALVGWVAVMLAAEGIGYRPAVLTAITAMVGLVSALWLVALTGGRFVDRHSKLLPGDVLGAGVTAASLTVVVPLFAPLAVLSRIASPYLTRAPRLLPPESGVGGRGGWSVVPGATAPVEPGRARHDGPPLGRRSED
ncbi:hypothetical protein A8924_1918 [Saccharopolyspora erythraea NRRL 2338]|uniref:Uncharacterized protein n=1 Tax=Saccharopolyspora erythraea TaxID=1836 RepID=A0ABP3LXS1_SACER|nr:hypothetical protein [Saccharopolyspora erythraea]PFG94628.1 hypothetical protein A8924_1918 [Saccharopolyspora erythraea NRRL 2338]QRK91360.1 hypothetical protein JQX30_08150 [Saccharopolyspora erythraea]